MAFVSLISGFAGSRAGRYGCRATVRGLRSAGVVCMVQASSESSTRYTKEDQWDGLCRNAGIWEGNQASYDKDGIEKKRVGSSVYIHTSGEREDGKPGPSDVWVHLLREGSQRYSQVYFSRDNFFARGMFMSPSGDMDSGFRTAVRENGTIIEQVISMDGEDDKCVGRVRIVHKGARNEEGFSTWIVFRERRSPQALPEYNSQIPQSREHPVEIRETNNPWDLNTKSEGSTFEQLRGSWKGVKHTIGAKDSTMRKSEYSFDVSYRDGKMDVNYLLHHETETLRLKGERMTDTMIRFSNGGELRDLGGGVTVLSPPTIPESGNLVVEMAWVLGNTRKRVARSYKDGEWVSSQYFIETRM